jgi:ankyrin repeat protein
MNEIESEIKRVFCKCDSGEEASIQTLEQAPPEALNRLLFQMIMFKSFPLLKLVIELGADVNHSSQGGVTPLHYACQEGQLEVAKYLVKSGALVFPLCDKGFSVFIYAARSLSIPMVQWTLAQGCDINHRVEGGFTALHAVVANRDAAENGQEPEICALLEFLLNKGASVSTVPFSPIAIAEANGLMHAAKLLQAHLPKASFFDDYVPGWMLFPNLIPSLIENGADLNKKNVDGQTPLLLAVQRGLLEQALIFIDHGSDIQTVDEAGWGLLHVLSAFHTGPEAVALTEKLISMGLDVNMRCPNGHTPLSLASLARENPDVAEILKRHGGVI